MRILLLVLVLCCPLLSPRGLPARTVSPSGTPSADEAAGSFVKRGDGGYVDMESDEEGDRFVDEDGDGIDDRRMRIHQNQKRHRQRWRDDAPRGSVSEEGVRGTGGAQGHGAGPGPGGGGR